MVGRVGGIPKKYSGESFKKLEACFRGKENNENSFASFLF